MATSKHFSKCSVQFKHYSFTFISETCWWVFRCAVLIKSLQKYATLKFDAMWHIYTTVSVINPTVDIQQVCGTWWLETNNVFIALLFFSLSFYVTMTVLGKPKHEYQSLQLQSTEDSDDHYDIISFEQWWIRCPTCTYITWKWQDTLHYNYPRICTHLYINTLHTS